MTDPEPSLIQCSVDDTTAVQSNPPLESIYGSSLNSSSINTNLPGAPNAPQGPARVTTLLSVHELFRQHKWETVFRGNAGMFRTPDGTEIPIDTKNGRSYNITAFSAQAVAIDPAIWCRRAKTLAVRMRLPLTVAIDPAIWCWRAKTLAGYKEWT